MQLPPPEPLRIRAVPPQLADLARLLGLDPAAGSQMMRADLRMASALPDMAPDTWMRATLSAKMPHLQLPRALPFGPGPLVSVMLRLGLAGRIFPLTDPARLIAALKQTMASFAQTTLPATKPLMAMATPSFANLTQAARLTLSLRQQGLCPLALAGVDMSFSMSQGLDEPRGTYAQAMRVAVNVASQPIQPFAMTMDQVRLATHFAGMAGLNTLHEPLNLPPASDPTFPTAAQMLMRALSAIPMPPLPMTPTELLELAGILDAIDAIKQAFGQDALTPAGTARVNAMLRYVGQLRLPGIGPLMAIQEQIDLLPDFDMVQSGAMAATSALPTLATSMTAPVPDLAFMPALDALGALGAVLENLLDQSPFGPCTACDFPIDNFLPA